MKTLSDHFQELGADFCEEIERGASDAKLILDAALKCGVPVDMLWNPNGIPVTPAAPGKPPPGRKSANAALAA